MWSRWDMQDHAPDILITNYSMLNIMLMRGVEAGIFDQTRSWLQADPSHVFHLVVDELHTYRGTPGTEVAYLIRVLLDRIGLRPELQSAPYYRFQRVHCCRCRGPTVPRIVFWARRKPV